MSTALVAMSDMEKMAAAIAKSGLFGMKRPEEAMALMIVAQAEGRHPGSVAAEYHIIQGRPALKADAMLARFQQAGGKVAWDAYTDEKVSAVFTHEAGGSVKVEWDMARAKKAGLGAKDNWSKYPRQMLRARVISEGVRTCYPAVCVGVYTPEEVQDFSELAPRRGRPPKDMGPAEVMPDPDDDALKTLEQNAAREATEAATPGTGPSSTSATPPAASSEPVKTRHEHLQELVDQSGMATTLAALLAKADAKHADELSDDDYRSLVNMLRTRITKRMLQGAAEAQP